MAVVTNNGFTYDGTNLVSTGGPTRSRYAKPADNLPTDRIENTRNTGASTGSSAGTSTSTGTGTTSGTSTTNSSQQTQNMDPRSLAILNNLIQQLLGGGTPDMQNQRGIRDNARRDAQDIRGNYSKDAAFSDSQGLVSQQMRRVLEQLLPSINRASEDAGSSGGALRALLMQDAASKAAESSSALGVKTAVDYGNIASNLTQVLERFTTMDNSATQALLGALGLSKGATVNTTGASTTNTTGTTTENKTVTENKTNTNNENKTGTNIVDYAPFNVSGSSNRNSNNSPIYFGPENSTPATNRPGTTVDFLDQLYGRSDSWAGYKF